MNDTVTSETPPTQTPPARRSWRGLVLKLGFSLLLFLFLFEMACQAYRYKANKSFKAYKANPGYYYEASSDPALTYELRRNFTYSVDNRRVHVTPFGIRDDDDAMPTAPRRIALLGDSVVFGTNQSQEFTISSLLQRKLDPTGKEVRVLNFGVPGYGAREIARYLEKQSAVLHPTEVLYIMNPNDFSWRNTRFEGADNGMYNLYTQPLLATPTVIRKLI